MRDSVGITRVVEAHEQSRDETARKWTNGGLNGCDWSCEMWASFARRFAFELGVC